MISVTESVYECRGLPSAESQIVHLDVPELPVTPAGNSLGSLDYLSHHSKFKGIDMSTEFREPDLAELFMEFALQALGR